MRRPRVILWDVDGTLAETERDGHRAAFNEAFAATGLPWRWDEAHYGRLLQVAGGLERLLHDMRSRDDAPAEAASRDALARALHERKNAFYARLVRSGRIPLREGVMPLLRQCRSQERRMGIATTTGRGNVEALLASHLGPAWGEWFAVVVCGEDVRRKKPDPEVFVRALELLGLRPRQAVAIEDSPAGVAAARAAGVPVIVTRSAYFAEAPIAGALAVGPGLHERSDWRPALPAGSGGVGLEDIDHWFVRS